MPSYDYRCVANGQIVEVKHGISDKLKTWGEVCACAGITLGDTSAETPVERLITGGQFVRSNTLKNPEPMCSTGSCCAGGMCGFN